jgi:DNA-binding MarR family transcriptional regulator
VVRSVGGSPGPGSAEPRRLGAALRWAWLAYHRRVEAAMVEAGFDDAAVPDGRVLRLCLEPLGTTISTIGRALGITRQGAGKLVGSLRDRGYLEVQPSASSGREKSVTATAKGRDYLALRRKAARRVEDDLRAELGADGYIQLRSLLQVLGGTEEWGGLHGPPDRGDRGMFDVGS